MDSTSPPSSQTKGKFLRTQQLVLLGIAAIAFIIGWFDGLNGFAHSIENTHAGQAVVMVNMRWNITFSLPLVSVVALVLAGIAYRRQQLFNVKTLVVSGVITVVTVIALSISSLIGFDSWIETQGYERCTALDITQGITRHGARNIESSAWTLIGQCQER